MKISPEYFGQIYLEASLEYGPDSRYVQNLFDFITKLDNFPEISLEYSENLSGELTFLKNFLGDLLTVEISTTTKQIPNTDSKFSYECLSSNLVPFPDDNKSLSIIAIKHGDYLYLSFILRNYKMIGDKFLHDLELELVDTQDRRSIEFPYILNGIFPSYSQITTIWSPREI